MTAPGPITADELMRLQPPDKQTELVRGRMIVREPPGCRHGDIAVNLTVVLSQFVRTHNLGRVWSETGYVLSSNPDTVRGPDVSFVRHERVPDPIPRGYARFAPDLAVEVLSPDDRPGEVLERVADYLNAGTHLVWVVDPDRRLVRVYGADGSVAEISESGALEGGDVLPGFRCTLEDVMRDG